MYSHERRWPVLAWRGRTWIASHEYPLLVGFDFCRQSMYNEKVWMKKWWNYNKYNCQLGITSASARHKSQVKGILWDRQWSPPSIWIFSPQMLICLQKCFSNYETSFRAIQALIASQSTLFVIWISFYTSSGVFWHILGIETLL